MAELTEKISAFLTPLLDGTDIFIVGIKVKPTNNIKVYLDSDSGLSIDKCVKVNRKLYAHIEEEQLFPAGDFSLEVSSPGIDGPLAGARQYKKNIGRTVTVTDTEGKEHTGVMTDATEEQVILEIKPAKPKEATVVKAIPFSNIKKAVVQITF